MRDFVERRRAVDKTHAPEVVGRGVVVIMIAAMLITIILGAA